MWAHVSNQDGYGSYRSCAGIEFQTAFLPGRESTKEPVEGAIPTFCRLKSGRVPCAPGWRGQFSQDWARHVAPVWGGAMGQGGVSATELGAFSEALSNLLI